MNKLNRLFVGLLLAVGCVVTLSLNSDASVVARGPKKVFNLNYTLAISSVTPFTVLQATSTVQDQPGAVYAIILGTGTAGDFVTLYDTVPFNAASLQTTPCTAAVSTNCGYLLAPRIYFGSTSATTNIVFDPPLIFYHGLLAMESAAGDQAGIVYEAGRGVSGQ